MLTAGVFSLLAVQLISDEGQVLIKNLPLRWLALAGLLTVSSCLVSIFKDFSVKEALTLWSIIAGSILAGHVAAQGHRRALIVTILASGILVTLLAVPSYLAAPAGSQAASALSGPFHYPNGLGSFLLLIVFLPCAFLFYGGTRLVSVASACALAVLGAALILTHSRGVWAAGLIALIVWTAVERKLIWAHRRRMALAAFLITSLVFMASRRPAEIAPRFASLAAATSRASDDPSYRWRWDIYAWTVDIVKDHPWIGTGIGTFPIAIKLYQRAPYVTGLYAHSHYLQTAAEMGFPALAGLLLFLGFLFRQGWKIIGFLEPLSLERSLAVGLTAGLASSSLHAAVDLGWSYPAVVLVFGIQAALLFSLVPPSLILADRSFPGPVGMKILRPVLLSLCLFMAALGGTRYYAELLRNQGNLALEVGERDRAVRAFHWSSRLNPLFYSPRRLLASAYASQGDMSSSQREAEAAFRLNPFDGDAYHALGRTHWLARSYEEAKSAFLSAVRLQPYTRLVFYYDLGEFFLAVGKPTEALVWLKRGTEIFRPEIVTSRVTRCLAPDDRYILARIYSRMAEISRSEGRLPEGKQAEEVASQLASPSMEEICFRAMTGPYLSPESTIVAYWGSRSRKDWPGVIATFSRDVDQRFKDESLSVLPPPIEAVKVGWIVSLVGNEDAAKVGYEVKLLSRDGAERRAAFRDTLVVERGGWRLRHRVIGLN
jgi:O-antigen ligase